MTDKMSRYRRRRAPDFPNLTLYCDFAHDVGEVFVAGRIGDEQYEQINQVAEAALRAAGFAEKSVEQRADLAMKCCRQILWTFEGAVLDEDTTELRGLRETRRDIVKHTGEGEVAPPFKPPSSASEGEDILVQAWLREPVGMERITPHKWIEARFAKDGSLKVTEVCRLKGEPH